MFSKSPKQRGFTIVELVVAVVVMGLLTGVVFDFVGEFYQDNLVSLGKTVQETDTRSALRTTEAELSNAAGFLSGLTVGAPLGKNNGTTWSYLGDDPDRRVLIADIVAATESPAADTNNDRLPVFEAVGGDCDPLVATPAKIKLVYFTALDPYPPGGTTAKLNLYRRTILPQPPATASYCDGVVPWQKQTCFVGPRSDPGALCQGTDALLIKDISAFRVDYFSTSNKTVPDVRSSDSSDQSATVSAAQTIEVTVVTNRKLDGNTVSNTASIRITRP